MNIVFRLDALKSEGIGHLMRSLALSEELTKRGNVCYFLSKIEDTHLIKKIENSKGVFRKIKIDTNYDEDLESLISFSNKNDIDWIVTDHYGIDTDYIQDLKKEGFNVLSIDDTAKMHYPSNIVINQNVGSEKLDFSSEQYTKILLGPEYVMMRDDLLKNNEKVVKQVVKNVLIAIGGSDHDNFTLKIIKLVEKVERNVKLLVVSGPFNPFYDELERYVKDSKLDIDLIKSPEDMSEIYLKSDIAISAGGTSCYELAYFGIPNIIITVAENQLNIAKELNSRKTSIYIGDKNNFKAEDLINNLQGLIDNDKLRMEMSKNGMKLIDGKGKQRIADFMEGDN